ncbi:MAG: NUDIX hydrolase [Candidatus Dormibacteria bacterium]
MEAPDRPSSTPASTLPPLLRALAAELTARAREYPAMKPSRKRAAGVLVLFFLRGDELRVLFFRRTDRVPTHKNQVAFPGGSKDRGDADLLETALREAREEVGLETARVTVLGAMRPFDTRVNNFAISPFCAYLADADPVWVPQDFEVEEILEIPLARLRDRRRRRLGLVPGFNIPFPLPYYEVDGAIIWGATGGVVAELIEALDKAEAGALE